MSTSSAGPLSPSSISSLLSPYTTTTGSSSFSTDLQNSVNRAVAIASLPLQELQADQSTISGQTSELNTLGTLFGTLQTSIQSLGSAAAGNAVTASVDDTS